MTFDTWWQREIAKRPPLADSSRRLTLNSAELRRALERAYDAGYKAATDNAAVEAILNGIMRPGR